MEGQPYPQSAPRNNTMAIVSLVLGILGLIGVLPVIGSIIAIITGNMAMKEIAANPAAFTGDGMARGGQILGWIGLGLWALGCVCFFALLALGLIPAFFIPFTETSWTVPALFIA